MTAGHTLVHYNRQVYTPI